MLYQGKDVFATPAEIKEIRWLMFRAMRAEGNAREREEMRLAMCQGKHKFDSYEAAKGSIRHRDIVAFHCKQCLKYHIGGAELTRTRRLNLIRKRKSPSYTGIEG